MSVWHQIAGKFHGHSIWVASLENRIETMSVELTALEDATVAIHNAVAAVETKIKLMSDEIERLKAGATDAADVASLAARIHAEADALTSATAAAVV